MSDTPRTDDNTYGGKGLIGAGYVSADFARQLERELNEVKKHCGDRYPDARTLEEIHKLRAELEKVREERFKCICVYCKKEFRKDSPELPDHILTCEKSPLVQMIGKVKIIVEDLESKLELSEAQVGVLQIEIAENNRAAALFDKHAADADRDKWKAMAKELAVELEYGPVAGCKGTALTNFNELEKSI